jgi:hypothetical protein
MKCRTTVRARPSWFDWAHHEGDWGILPAKRIQSGSERPTVFVATDIPTRIS